MLLHELSKPAFNLLDGASNGVLSALRARYPRVHLTVQTKLEGLPEGQMKLFISVEGETDYAIARLGGSALMVGWDIYLHDITQSVRQHVERIHETLDALEAETAADLAPPTARATLDE
jgi:hypothetical protein